MNTAWHARHPMPKGPSLDDRLRWHFAHQRACGCREIPPLVLAEAKRRGLAPPRHRPQPRAKTRTS